MKQCRNVACGKPVVRRAGEYNSNYIRRNYCGRSCACSARNRMLERKPESVHCTGEGCDAIVVRSTYKSRAKCAGCKKALQRQIENRYSENLREQAKRYRILMTTLGWDSYPELMDYLRTVPWASVVGRPHKDLRAAV